MANKTVELRVRMTEEDKATIARAAQIRGMTVSQFVRDQMLLTSEMMALVKDKEISEDSFLDLQIARIKELSEHAAS